MKQPTVVLTLLVASTFCVAQDKPVTAERGSWSLSSDTNPMDNTRTIVATTTAETGKILAVRCTGRNLEIIVNPHTTTPLYMAIPDGYNKNHEGQCRRGKEQASRIDSRCRKW
jgi:hypothetical protein